MPPFLEADLRAEAAKKGLTGRRADRYVYGAMNNDGAMRGNQETAKGAAMQVKHDRQERAGTAEDEQRHMPHPARNLGGHLKPPTHGEVVTNHHRSSKRKG